MVSSRWAVQSDLVGIGTAYMPSKIGIELWILIVAAAFAWAMVTSLSLPLDDDQAAIDATPVLPQIWSLSTTASVRD
jgi:hypothetical protein